MEVAVVGVRVEVGDAAGEFDRGEDSAALFGASLLSRGGHGLDGGESIGGNGCRAATATMVLAVGLSAKLKLGWAYLVLPLVWPVSDRGVIPLSSPTEVLLMVLVSWECCGFLGLGRSTWSCVAPLGAVAVEAIVSGLVGVDWSYRRSSDRSRVGRLKVVKLAGARPESWDAMEHGQVDRCSRSSAEVRTQAWRQRKEGNASDDASGERWSTTTGNGDVGSCFFLGSSRKGDD